jgi:uncharacterized membrane protein YsdA (DUF1294 family)/cold shock CspA family protein
MAIADKRSMPKSLPTEKGSIVMWNDQKGFGFIRPENGTEDHFVHISAFKKGMSRRPEIGDQVQFRPVVGPGKKRAAFAEIEGLVYVEPGRKPFTLIPKHRSWLTNLLILTPLTFSGFLLFQGKNPIPFFAYCFFSVLMLFLYGADKTQAAIKSWRVPDTYLHILEIMGGWPGALMAQNEFRHKTRQTRYQIVFRSIIALHLLGWGAYFLWSYQVLG